MLIHMGQAEYLALKLVYHYKKNKYGVDLNSFIPDPSS